MNFNRILRPIIDPGPVPVLFVIGVVLFSVIGNGIYELVKEWLGGGALASALALMLLVLVLLTYAVYGWLRRRVRTVVAQDDVPPLSGQPKKVDR
jgi:hypothetical protein